MFGHKDLEQCGENWSVVFKALLKQTTTVDFVDSCFRFVTKMPHEAHLKQQCFLLDIS